MLPFGTVSRFLSRFLSIASITLLAFVSARLIARDVRFSVAVNAGCVGGFPGLSEMTGNVGEWESSCASTTPGDAGEDDMCEVRGGDVHDDFPNQWCDQDYQVRRAGRMPTTGIRCCSDVAGGFGP